MNKVKGKFGNIDIFLPSTTLQVNNFPQQLKFRFVLWLTMPLSAGPTRHWANIGRITGVKIQINIAKYVSKLLIYGAKMLDKGL